MPHTLLWCLNYSDYGISIIFFWRATARPIGGKGGRGGAGVGGGPKSQDCSLLILAGAHCAEFEVQLRAWSKKAGLEVALIGI